MVSAINACPTLAAPADIAARDRLAAHPDDRDKPAGVKGSYDIAKADVAAALKACKAVAAMPDAPRRIHLELGRALEFNRQNAEAVKAYRRAADAGSTSAGSERFWSTAMASRPIQRKRGCGSRKPPTPAM